MKQYKMRRGEHLDDRMPNLESEIEAYFGPIAGTEDHDGHELFVVEEPDNPAFERVVVGRAEYSGKKDRVALHIDERDVAELVAEGAVEAADEAVETKNDFLEAATGRDAKARRDSMKRAVEDDAPDV